MSLSKRIKAGQTFRPYGKRKATITEVKSDCISFEMSIAHGVLITGSMTRSAFKEARNREKNKVV